MKSSEINRRYILLAIVGVIIVGIFLSEWLGSKQDEQFLYEDQLFNTVQEYVNNGRGQEALPYLQELLETHANSEAVNYMAALVYADTEDMNASAVHMQKVIDINPYKVEDAIFMIQFGEILFFTERYDDAETVLIRCQDSGWMPESFPEYQQRVQQLLDEIEAF